MSIDDLKAIADIIQAVVTTAGIIAAGVWTLYNFGLTRSAAARVEMELILKSVMDIRGHRIAIVALRVKNVGRTKVEKKYAVLAVRPLRIQETWLPMTRIDTPIDYHQGELHEVLIGHTFLEPSDEYHEEYGFVVDDFDVLQAGIVFAGPKQGQTWVNYLFDVSMASTREKAC